MKQNEYVGLVVIAVLFTLMSSLVYIQTAEALMAEANPDIISLTLPEPTMQLASEEEPIDPIIIVIGPGK